MSQDHRITLIMESAETVERTDGLNVIELTATEFTNLLIKLMYLKIMAKNTQKILDLIGP